jgi:hypothetical protein
MTIKSPIAKFIALIFVSVALAWLSIGVDGASLARMNSMSPTEYIEYQRNLHHHSFLHHLFVWIMIGGFYIASVEFIAFVIGLFFKKPAA